MTDVEQVDELPNIAEFYENDDEIPPTEILLGIAKSFIKSAMAEFKEQYPKAKFITPDLNGGLRIEYRNGEKDLRLILRTDTIFLYWQEGDQYGGVEIGGNRALLNSKLVWLLNL